MNVGTFKLNCYLEGIRVPIINFSSSYERNGISFGTITIPISGRIDGQMFANAFVQITVIDNTREKLVYQGLCIDMIVYEAESKVELTLQSLWGIFNFNTTLDYVSPRKYGLLNLEETLTLYVGNEEKVASPDFGLAEPSYRLSNRYFFVEADKETSQTEYNDVDANKLEFIITRIPFAERFAFSFFEQMAYGNFILTKAHAERFNLLNKIEAGQRIKKAENVLYEELLLTYGFNVPLDQSRTGFSHRELEFDERTEKFPTTTQIKGIPNGLEQIKQTFGEAGTNIVKIQAKCGKGGSLGYVELNSGIKDIFIKTFEEIERRNLGKHIKSWGGMYSYRTKNTAKGKSLSMSTHAWGIAFDINVADNSLNTQPSEDQKILAQVFEEFGWYWGKHFDDPMHFQYCTGY